MGQIKKDPPLSIKTDPPPGVSPADFEAHKTAVPIDHADSSVTKAKLALPLEMVKNAGIATSTTVTETVETLKQSVGPDTGFSYFVYIEGVHLLASNPTGSGATLSMIPRALLDDGTEVDLSDAVTVAEGASFDDWLRWVKGRVTGGRTISEVRLYASVDVAPAAGYEPTVQLERVTGIQV